MEAAPNKPSTYCRQCQYVLDGLPGSRCPECGTGFDPSDPATFWSAPKKAWRLPLRWECIASLICIIVFWLILPGGRRLYLRPVTTFLIPIFLVAFAVGLGLSGCRRGSKVSRVISALALAIALLLTLGMTSYLTFPVN